MSNFHDATNYIGNIIDMNKKNEFNSRNVSSLTGGKMVEGVMVVVVAEEDNNMAKGEDIQQIVTLAIMQVKVADMLISPERWISSEDWQNMPEKEKESIRNARSNYVKRKICAVSSHDDGNNEEQQAEETLRSGTKRVTVVDNASAGDYMSRGGRGYISQIRSEPRCVLEDFFTALMSR
jgi:hypothetical protein